MGMGIKKIFPTGMGTDMGTGMGMRLINGDGDAKEVTGWTPDFNDFDEDLSDTDDDAQSVKSEENTKNVISDVDSEIEEIPKTIFEQADHGDIKSTAEKGKISEDIEDGQSADPFNLYDLLKKKKHVSVKIPQTQEEPKYPPGFTPCVTSEVNSNVEPFPSRGAEEHNKNSHDMAKVSPVTKHVPNSNTKEDDAGVSNSSGHFRSVGAPKSGGSILLLMEDLINVGQTMGYKMDGCINNFEEIVKNQGETKMEQVNLFNIKSCWGNLSFDFAVSPSVGNSGGILCVWDPKMFLKENSTVSDYFIAIMGKWVPNDKNLLIISVYAPQELSEKKMLWNYLNHMIDRWKGDVIIMGDFNEVRCQEERFGSIFNSQGAAAFNNFISLGGLVEVSSGGYSFTWSHKSASKMSKLDRFLISDSLLRSCPNISALILDRFLSDHRPILLRESHFDYGPTPFHFYHSWFELIGFDSFLEDTWRDIKCCDTNPMLRLVNKLKLLKKEIRKWVKDNNDKSKNHKYNLKQRLAEIDSLLDKGEGSTVILEERMSIMFKLTNLDNIDSLALAQKAKIKWSIEGDENTKKIHGIINKQRNNLAIRGILVDGAWIEDPIAVKNEFLNHFRDRFNSPCSERFVLDMDFPNKLTIDQKNDLERPFTKEEIKGAIWDCGLNKSPGPDGDNSSFIALIPKTFNAKLVKDFRPISLIGSLYKIIAKILANRLVLVMGDLVNEVQSAFIDNRNILDGPFILNEVMQWSKAKNKHTMIFKVDFEKAFDSVRWDFLVDVLKKFGFGDHWCNWIKSCLCSSRGSILVNGSPTSEFQFQKGLKQGDPLSPFLFILVMESLHLSFQKVVNAGLRINMHKIKIMGVAVENSKVSWAATDIGCMILKAPFSYLGVKIGDLVLKLSQPDLDVSFRRKPRGGAEQDQISSVEFTVASIRQLH
ncbi:RNA-directed DNA polymerase, eukaryota [Tanacetum coccineum]